MQFDLLLYRMYQTSATNHRWVHTPISQCNYSSGLPKIPPSVLGRRNRPLEYRCYSEINVTESFEAIKKGLSFCKAEKEFGVPSSTLHDHASSHVAPGAHSGPPKYLSDNEEKELVDFLLGSRIGYACTRKQVLALVEATVTEKRGTQVILSIGLWFGFPNNTLSLLFDV